MKFLDKAGVATLISDLAMKLKTVFALKSNIPAGAITSPSMDGGTATIGTSTRYAREDHVHPTDTSRQAKLVSGSNIKTIHGKSIVGSGDITLSASDFASGNVASLTYTVVRTW